MGAHIDKVERDLSEPSLQAPEMFGVWRCPTRTLLQSKKWSAAVPAARHQYCALRNRVAADGLPRLKRQNTTRRLVLQLDVRDGFIFVCMAPNASRSRFGRRRAITNT
jgi:hypothetical protein